MDVGDRPNTSAGVVRQTGCGNSRNSGDLAQDVEAAATYKTIGEEKAGSFTSKPCINAMPEIVVMKTIGLKPAFPH
jgi:hypothetical protein